MRSQAKYAKVDPNNPEAWAQCDRCGFFRNRTDLVWQIEWAGTHLYNVRLLVCTDRCFDTPQEQFRTIILPPDPPSVINARVPDFAYEEQIVLIAQQGANTPEPPWAAGPQLLLSDQSGTVPLVAQYLNDV